MDYFGRDHARGLRVTRLLSQEDIDNADESTLRNFQSSLKRDLTVYRRSIPEYAFRTRATDSTIARTVSDLSAVEQKIRQITSSKVEGRRSVVRSSAFMPVDQKTMMNVFNFNTLKKIARKIEEELVLRRRVRSPVLSRPVSTEPVEPNQRRPYVPSSAAVSDGAVGVRVDSPEEIRPEERIFARTKEETINNIVSVDFHMVAVRSTINEMNDKDLKTLVKYFQNLGFLVDMKLNEKVEKKRNAIKHVVYRLFVLDPSKRNRKRLPQSVIDKISENLGSKLNIGSRGRRRKRTSKRKTSKSKKEKKNKEEEEKKEEKKKEEKKSGGIFGFFT